MSGSRPSGVLQTQKSRRRCRGLASYVHFLLFLILPTSIIEFAIRSGDIEERIEKLDSESSKRKRKKHKSSTPADAEAPKENEEVNEDAEVHAMLCSVFSLLRISVLPV